MIKQIKLLFALCLLVSSAHATWSAVQNANGAGAANAATCTVAVSATGTSHQMIAGVSSAASAADKISGVSGGGTWTLCTNCALVTGPGGASVDEAYNLSTSGGATSIIITLTTAPTTAWSCWVGEFSASKSPILFDVSNSVMRTASASQTSPTLTLAANDLVVSILSEPSGTNSLVNCNSPYVNPDVQFSTVITLGAACGALNQTGSTSATFNTLSSVTAVISILALKEPAGILCTITLLGAGPC